MRRTTTLFTAIALSIAAQAAISVDLGLSVRWATCNVGASRPEAPGCRYAWGETDPKSNYSWSNYKYGSAYNAMTKYCDDSDYGIVDNKSTLEASDDVATKICGEGWRIPTQAEWEELLTKCTWKWVTNYDSSQVNGYTIIGTNGDSIFLPVTGFCYADKMQQTNGGFYWSSSLHTTPSDAYYVQFSSNSIAVSNNFRFYGQAVRPVEVIKHNINIVAGENGKVTSAITQCVLGDTVALTVEPNKGCELDEIIVKDANNNAVAVTADYKFVMPSSDVTVTATFIEIDYLITINEHIENGSLTAVPSAHYGETVEIEVNADPGYQLSRIFIYDADGAVPVAEDLTFIMPASDVTITATFEHATATALQTAESVELCTENGRIVCNGNFRIYDLLGRDVTQLNGQLNGVYLVKIGIKTQKIRL
jgi:uncharacterized protein (TIGR02145 family)